VIHELTQEGIGVNATAILSFNQATLAAMAGASYVSIFAGRVADEGNDPAVVIRNVRSWLDEWDHSALIIVGSIRGAINIQNAALAGAHIVTIQTQFFAKMVDHRYTRNRTAVRSGRREITGANKQSESSCSGPKRRVKDLHGEPFGSNASRGFGAAQYM